VLAYPYAPADLPNRFLHIFHQPQYFDHQHHIIIDHIGDPSKLKPLNSVHVDNEKCMKIMKKYVDTYAFGTLTEPHFNTFVDAFAAVLLERYVNQLATFMQKHGGSNYFTEVGFKLIMFLC
jgi:hypothetical protein